MPVAIEALASVGVPDAVKQMLLALPDFSVGDRIHDAWVNRLEGATPGTSSSRITGGKRFVDLFFPGWSPGEFHADVSPLSGLGDDFWSGFAVAVLCQSMDRITSDLHAQLKHDDIDHAVSSDNTRLTAASAPFYARVFEALWTDFNQPLATMDHAAARAAYVGALKDGVALHALWYSEGTWKNPDWELFHHYVKLLRLGATADEIDALIGDLKSRGLPVPASVDQVTWRSYSGYLVDHPVVDHGDIDDSARNAILASLWTPNPFGRGEDQPEGNSFDFTASGGPGNQYRGDLPSGSCFAETTLVLMGDGALRAIGEVRPGDVVRSPSGPRQVALVATPLRQGRHLFSFNRESLRFTGTHPFVAAPSEPQETPLLAVEPDQLHRWVPTLAHGGVGTLRPGARLAGIGAGADRLYDVPVESVETHAAPHDADELLYDLILTPEGSGVASYVVGSDAALFVAASEMPVVSRAPHAAVAVLQTLETVVPLLRRRFGAATRPDYQEFLWRLHRRMTSGLLHAALSTDPTDPDRVVLPPDEVESRVGATMRGLATSDGGYDWVGGAFYETLASAMADEIEAAAQHPWRRVPATGGERLALTVHELRLRPEHAPHAPAGMRLLLTPVVRGVYGETQIVDDRGGRPNSRFARYFDRNVILDTRVDEGGMPAKIQLQFHPLARHRPLYVGELYLPDALSTPYRRRRACVHAVDGAEAGELFADVRLLSMSAATAEAAEHRGVDAPSRLAFAAMLGRRMAAVLTEWVTSEPGAAQS